MENDLIYIVRKINENFTMITVQELEF